MNSENINTVEHDQPKTRGLIAFLVFAGLGGLYTALNTWNLFSNAPLLQKWSLIVIFIVSLIAIGSAVLIFQRKLSGLILGLSSISFLLYLFMAQTESHIALASSGQGAFSLIAILSVVGLLLSCAVVYYLIKYLMSQADREYFS